MKPKIFIEDNNCPFPDDKTIICEAWIDDSKSWYKEATHICSCADTRKHY